MPPRTPARWITLAALLMVCGTSDEGMVRSDSRWNCETFCTKSNWAVKGQSCIFGTGLGEKQCLDSYVAPWKHGLVARCRYENGRCLLDEADPYTCDIYGECYSHDQAWECSDFCQDNYTNLVTTSLQCSHFNNDPKECHKMYLYPWQGFEGEDKPAPFTAIRCRWLNGMCTETVATARHCKLPDACHSAAPTVAPTSAPTAPTPRAKPSPTHHPTNTPTTAVPTPQPTKELILTYVPTMPPSPPPPPTRTPTSSAPTPPPTPSPTAVRLPDPWPCWKFCLHTNLKAKFSMCGEFGYDPQRCLQSYEYPVRGDQAVRCKHQFGKCSVDLSTARTCQLNDLCSKVTPHPTASPPTPSTSGPRPRHEAPGSNEEKTATKEAAHAKQGRDTVSAKGRMHSEEQSDHQGSATNGDMPRTQDTNRTIPVRLLWLLISVLLCLVCGAGGYFLWRRATKPAGVDDDVLSSMPRVQSRAVSSRRVASFRQLRQNDGGPGDLRPEASQAVE